LNKETTRWEYWGIPIIIVCGALLHFVFEWSGRLPIVGAIAAVNESVWEHFKLGFWPALFYGIIGYFKLKQSRQNYWFAKAAGIYLIPLVISLVFYTYTAILGDEILAIDIGSFVLAVVICQIISLKIINRKALPRWLNVTGVAVLALMAAAFIAFSYYPPHLPLFMDGPTGTYGIP